MSRFLGIPITTVPRTLTGLASHLSTAELARALHEAGVRYGTTPDHVEAVLERRPRGAGRRQLARVLTGDDPILLSKLEARFRRLLRDANLPRTNVRVPEGYVDCRREDPPLTVELDSYRYHSSRHAWEQDRRRERRARARGDDYRRYTYGDVFEDPRLMLDELALILAPWSSPSTGPPGPGRAPLPGPSRTG